MSGNRPVGKAVRAAIVVTAVAAVMNLVIDLGSEGFYTTFAVFVLLVLSDFSGPLKTRFAAYLTTGGVGMALITLGALAATHIVATILVTLVVAFVLCYTLVLRGYVTAAYVSLLLTYIVAVTTPQALDRLGVALAAYAAGALVAAIAAVTLWPSRPTSDIVGALRRVLDAAGQLVARARHSGEAADVSAAATRLDAAYEALTDTYRGNLRRQGVATSRDRGLVRLVDDVGRLCIALRTAGRSGEPAGADDAPLMEAVETTLTACATAVSDGTPPDDAVRDDLLAARARHITALPDRVDAMVGAGDVDRVYRVADAGFADRVVSFISMMILRHTEAFLGRARPRADAEHRVASHAEAVASIETTAAPRALLTANLHLDSPWVRRAIQVALAVTISVTVIHELHLQTGFWVILGVVASLQLSAIRSRKSARQVLIGTILGFIICAVLVQVVDDRLWLLVGLLPIAGFLSVWYPHGRYLVPLTQAGYTVWFVLLVSLGHHQMAITTPDTRIIDVSVGLCASLIVTGVLWPRGVATRVREVLDASVQATSEFFTAAVAWITPVGTRRHAETADDAAHRARQARVRAVEAFDLAISQGGATAGEAHRWVVVTNAVDHGVVAGTMVRGLGNYGLAPVPDADAAAALRAHADHAADQFTAMIHHEQQDDPVPWEPGDLEALDDVITRAIDRWASSGGDVTFQIPPEAFTMSPGHAALSMRWTRDWTAYFGWMAHHSRPVHPDPTSATGSLPAG